MAALREGRHDVEVGRVELTGADGEIIPAIHARPDGMPVRGLVLHPDIGGLRPVFDDVCRRLATNGVAVCAPEPFGRALTSGVELGDLNRRLSYVRELDDELQLGDLEAAADYLVVNDDVSDVAVLGFCMGGMYALKAAATSRFDRAVSFYGMVRLPEAWRGDGQGEPLDGVGAMCPTLAIFGGRDTFTPETDIQALRAAWEGREDCKVVVYADAEHGFVHDVDRPAHRAEDAENAWACVFDFLGIARP